MKTRSVEDRPGALRFGLRQQHSAAEGGPQMKLKQRPYQGFTADCNIDDMSNLPILFNFVSAKIYVFRSRKTTLSSMLVWCLIHEFTRNFHKARAFFSRGGCHGHCQAVGLALSVELSRDLGGWVF